MSRLRGRLVLAVAAAGLLLSVAVRSAADLADVYLKNGIVLRGDVTTTDDEVIVKNAAGEMRLPRSEVDRIEPARSATQPVATQPAGPPKQRTEKPTRPGPETLPAREDGERTDLPAAPLLSAADIQKLRLHELKLDIEDEQVRVRFKKRPRQRDLAQEVLEDLKNRPEFDQRAREWEQVLMQGTPQEKLQLIIRQTGMKYADRIEIETDPQVFDAFRRRIVPIITKSCGRSGCHAGAAAQAFRFPLSTASNEEYAYTVFALLDQMQTPQGPLIDRDDPEGSVLLHYLLPPDQTRKPHPQLRRGQTYNAALRNREDRQYAQVLSWINDLAVPRPKYGLQYENPYPGTTTRPATQPATLPLTRPARL
jgi:hypothetical protein